MNTLSDSTRGTSDADETLLVFAAASLTDAFQSIGTSFQEGKPEVEVQLNLGGSQQLAQQIVGGAPGDVFASANRVQMQIATDSGRISETAVRTFATNELVIIFPPDNPAQVTTLQDLANPGTRLVLAAQEVPAGRYALQFLDNAAAELGTDYRERVLQNVASYELNVRAVLTKVTLGEADAGIVYSSDISGLSSAEVGKLEIPEHLNVVAYYYVAPLNDAANSSLARAFVDYILSAPGQGILRRYGLIPVSDSAQE